MNSDIPICGRQNPGSWSRRCPGIESGQGLRRGVKAVAGGLMHRGCEYTDALPLSYSYMYYIHKFLSRHAMTFRTARPPGASLQDDCHGPGLLIHCCGYMEARCLQFGLGIERRRRSELPSPDSKTLLGNMATDTRLRLHCSACSQELHGVCTKSRALGSLCYGTYLHALLSKTLENRKHMDP